MDLTLLKPEDFHIEYCILDFDRVEDLRVWVNLPDGSSWTRNLSWVRECPPHEPLQILMHNLLNELRLMELNTNESQNGEEVSKEKPCRKGTKATSVKTSYSI